MATYTVQAPDGKQITIEGPEGASQEEVIAKAQQLYKPKVSVIDEMFGAGSPTARFVKGAVVDPLLELNRMVAETGLLGQTVKQQAKGNQQIYEQATQEGRKRIGSTGFDWTQAAGSVVGSLIPGTQPTKAATGLGRVGQATGMGALFGGLTPTTGEGDYVSEKLGQMGTGALFGGLLSGGIEAGSKIGEIVKELASPLTSSGRMEALRKYISGLSPDVQNEINTALKTAPELVAGSKPTAAEAVANIPGATGLAAYQEALSKVTKKGVAGKFAERATEQQAARQAALEEIGQTPGFLDFAKSLRDFDATRNYGEAFNASITADPNLAKLVTRNPYIQKALPDAIDLAQAKGISAKTDLTEFLHYVKLSLDKQLTKTGDTALSATEKQAVQSAKGELLGWLKVKNPAYEKARELFADASKPINQMEIGQYLEKQLGTPLGNKERAAAFATAVQEATSTIKKSSGAAAGEKLSDILTPKQSAIVDNVLADLQRKAKSETLASQSKVGNIGVEKGGELPNVLNRAATYTNFILKALKRDANDEINRVAAEMLLDPVKLAAFMENVPKNRVKGIIEPFMAKLTPELRDNFSRMLAIKGATAINLQAEPKQ